MQLAIIGHGFVGKAVEHGFSTPDVTATIIDPKGGQDISVLNNKQIDLSFVCVPTPMGDDGSINASIVRETVDYLVANVTGLIVLKSTVTPDIVKELSELTDRFVYNPEFLTERNAAHDFEYPIMHVFGGELWACEQLERLYQDYSICKPCPVYFMKAHEASFVKYGINSFLATKVAWFNEFYDVIQTHDGNYDTIVEAVGNDKRVSSSHMQVPGPDGKRWAAGACFPKDMMAFKRFDENNYMEILKQTIVSNSRGRSQYELDDREKEQAVNFNISL